MALNAYVTASGGEIGYCAAVQLGWYRSFGRNEPHLHLNPRRHDLQVILRVKPWEGKAADYYEQFFRGRVQAIKESVFREKFDLIVCRRSW